MEAKKECHKCQKSEGELLKCACNSVYYCGRECQKADWKEHKPQCNYQSAAKSNTEKIEQKEQKPEVPSKAENYKKLEKVGDGNFSEIWLVEKNDTKEKFALKIISQQRLRQLHKENDVVMEIHCLNRLADSEYIIKLHEKFKDEISLFIVMEYVPAGELWDRLRSFGLVAESLIKYFYAHLLKAVEFIHSKGIVHRDLKPENIMIDTNNKIKLIDFGTARDLENLEIKGAGNSARGKRVFDHFVGTPQYMAPECVRNKDSNKKSDVWSLGCILYQFIAGFSPFLGGSEYLVFTKSLEKPPVFNKNLFSDQVIELITLMLEKDHTKRIGLEEVMKHPYFADVDFENIITYEEAISKIKPYEMDMIEVKKKLMSIEGNEEENIKDIIDKSKTFLKEKYASDETIRTKCEKWVDLMKHQARAHWHLEEFDWHK